MKERMRNELLAAISDALDAEQLQLLARRFDEVAIGYDVTQAQLSLAVVGREEFERIIKTFLVVKGMEGMARGTLENYAQRLKALMMYSLKPIGAGRAWECRHYAARLQAYDGHAGAVQRHAGGGHPAAAGTRHGGHDDGVCARRSGRCAGEAQKVYRMTKGRHCRPFPLPACCVNG